MRQDSGFDCDAWRIFLEIFADKEAELELLEDDYQSPIPEELR